MKKLILMGMVLIPLALTGCASKAGNVAAGALGGAAAGGGVYEYRLHQALQKVEDDYKAGRIDQKEYEARKAEIQKMQLIK